MGTNRLPDKMEFICDICNEIHHVDDRCVNHWDGGSWVSQECCVGCQEDDTNPPDEGRGSIYVDPEGIR